MSQTARARFQILQQMLDDHLASLPREDRVEYIAAARESLSLHAGAARKTAYSAKHASAIDGAR